jgi:hypothetical protein
MTCKEFENALLGRLLNAPVLLTLEMTEVAVLDEAKCCHGVTNWDGGTSSCASTTYLDLSKTHPSQGQNEDLRREIMGQDLGPDGARKRVFHVQVIIHCAFPLFQYNTRGRHNSSEFTVMMHLDMISNWPE